MWHAVVMGGKRWDVDETGHGLASGEAFGPNLEELSTAMRDPGWVTEDPDIHLLAHLRSACDEAGSRWSIDAVRDEDGVLIVDVRWAGESQSAGALRRDAFALLGRVAEDSTHIRQRVFDDRTEFEMATGALAGVTPFLPHGHPVRVRVRRISG